MRFLAIESPQDEPRSDHEFAAAVHAGERAAFDARHGRPGNRVEGGEVTHTRQDSSGGPANPDRISLLGATGKTKVDRP